MTYQKRRPVLSQLMRTKHLIFALAVIILLILIAFPLGIMFYKSFVVEGQLSFGNYVEVFTERRNLAPVINTIKLGGLTVILSTVIGVAAAWLVARTDLPHKGLLDTLFLTPYMIPPFIGAIAWIQLLSPRVGYLNRFWVQLFNTPQTPFNIYSLAGIVWVMSLHNYPFVYIIVRGALERMDPSLEEVAHMSGAGRLRVMWDITLRLVMPSITGGMLIVFIYTIANFGIPALIGMRARFFVLTTQIYSYIYTGDFSGIKLAASLSTLLMFIAGAGVILNRWYLRRKQYTVISGKSVRPNLVRLRRWRTPVFILVLIFFVIAVIAPLISVFSSAFLRAWGVSFTLENLTFDNFYYILFEYDLTRLAIRNSVVLALSAATLTTIIGSIAAYINVKTDLRGRQLLDVLATLPYAIPGTVVALSMILAWSGAYRINLYNTFWIILVAYIARYMFFAFRNVSSSLSQIHPSLEEVAMVSGADWLRNFRDIIVPLIKPGLIASWFLIFMPTLRELTISILLWGPRTPTIGVAVFEMQDAGYYQNSAALASIILLVVLIGNYLLRKVMGVKISM